MVVVLDPQYLTFKLLGSYSLVGIGKFNLLYIPVAYWGSNAGFEKQGFGVPYFNTFWGPVT